MAQRRTSPRRSGGSESAVKNRSTSPGPKLKKALNEQGSIFNCLIFIEVFRELSKHTTYKVLLCTYILTFTNMIQGFIYWKIPKSQPMSFGGKNMKMEKRKKMENVKE